MIDFRDYLRECMDGVPAIIGDSDASNMRRLEDRDSVNFMLSDITDIESRPEVAYERVRGILQDIGYLIPPASSHTDLFMEDFGEAIIPLIHGETTTPVFLYFAFCDQEVLAEIATESELMSIFEESDVCDL